MKKPVSIVFLALLALTLGFALAQQLSAGPRVAVVDTKPAAAAANRPTPSDLELAYIQIAALTQQLATCQSAQLESVKQANIVYQDVLGRIEKAHPGFTVDWKTGGLVPKIAAAK